MGEGPKRKWHPNRLWCFARRDSASESGEQWIRALSSSRRSKNKDLSRAQSAQILSRDSEDDLRAYLGQGQLQRSGSVSVLAQAACTAEMERRLKGLPVDVSVSPGNAVGSNAAKNLGSSELSSSALIAAEHQHKPMPETQANQNSGAIADQSSEVARNRTLALPVSPFVQDPNLEAAGDGQKPLCISTNDGEISSVAHEKQLVGTPPPSDRLRPPMALTSNGGSSALCTSISSVSQRLEDSHAYSSVKSYSNPECADESSNVSYRSQEVLTEDDEGTTELTLAPSSRVNTTSFIINLTRNILPDLLEAGPGEVEQHRRVLRAHTMPHRSSSSKDSLTLVASTNLTRRHTAVVLITTSDDEDENEAGRVGKTSDRGELAEACPKKLQRNISDVYEGHHVQLQKLRKQMSSPGSPASDLLTVVARRIFTQQSSLSRTESEAPVSTSQHSSPAVEAGLGDASGWYSPKLPPIKTRVE